VTIYFTPYAWAKLLFFRDSSENEVSVFGITPKDPTIIEDVALPKQEVRTTYVDIDDKGLAIMCDELAQKGLQPSQFMRIWIHTHPKGMGPQPSSKDNETMLKAFGACDWAMMMIVAKNGEISCRLEYNKEVTAAWPDPKTQKGRVAEACEVKRTYMTEFPATDFAAWKKEYDEKVTPEKMMVVEDYASMVWDPHWRETLGLMIHKAGWNQATVKEASEKMALFVDRTCISAHEGKMIMSIVASSAPRSTEGHERLNEMILKRLQIYVEDVGTYPKKRKDLDDAAGHFYTYFTGNAWVSPQNFDTKHEKKKQEIVMVETPLANNRSAMSLLVG